MALEESLKRALLDWMKQFHGPGGIAGWAWRQMGGKRWLRERGCHAPGSVVEVLAARRRTVEQEIKTKYPHLTDLECEWRAFEATVCEAIEQKTVKALESHLPALPIPGWIP